MALSHYSFNLIVIDDWQTQDKSVDCIRHLPSLIRKLWKLYDELMTYDKVTNSEVDVQKLLKLTYEKLMTHLGETFDSL